MSALYNKPKVLDELGTSDHCMVVLSPYVRGCTKFMLPPGVWAITRRYCSQVKWEPLHRMDKCKDEFLYYQSILDGLEGMNLL